MPKSQIFINAKKMKKFGHKAFQYFKEILECDHKEFLKYSRKLNPGYYAAQFRKEIEEYQWDILFEEPGTNPLTRIRVIDNSKNLNPAKKNANKELVIEITGLNYLLNEAISLDKKGADSHKTKSEATEKRIVSSKDEEDSIDIDLELGIKDNSSAMDEENRNIVPSTKVPTKESVALIEELLGQNSKNKPFFYFNPVAIQFTNPNLIGKDICYLCGSFGDTSSFICCSTCQEAYHYFCISRSYNDESKFQRIKSNPNWQCPKCKLCQKCEKKSESHDCLICETCDNLYHLNCIYPQIGVLFPSEWRCEDCFSCSRCGSKKLFSSNLNVETGNIQPEFCENFKYCYECGLKMAYYKFCKICKKYCQKSISSSKVESRSLQYIDPAEDSIECSTCKFKYHFSCYEEEYSPITDYDNFSCYNCKVNDDEIMKIENDLNEKAEKIIAKRRNIKQLMRICETIYNTYFVTNPKNEYMKENYNKLLFDYIIEDYNFLTIEPHIKTMIENYRLLNAATKLMNTKHQPQASSSTAVKSESQHRKFSSVEEYLSNIIETFNFNYHIVIPISDTQLPSNFEYSELIDILPTDTSRDLYDYSQYIKIPDPYSNNWMLVHGDLNNQWSPIFSTTVPFTLENFGLELISKSESVQQLIHRRKKDISLGKLLTITYLLETRDNFIFTRVKESYERYEIEENFDSIEGICSLVSIPYARNLDEIRIYVAFEKNPKRTERGMLVGRAHERKFEYKSRETNLFSEIKFFETKASDIAIESSNDQAMAIEPVKNPFSHEGTMISNFIH